MFLKMFNTPEFWYKKNIISKLQIILLYPFSILWTLIDDFKRYSSKTYKSKLKVLCVGNLSVGGTGKTPFSIYTFKNCWVFSMIMISHHPSSKRA